MYCFSDYDYAGDKVVCGGVRCVDKRCFCWQDAHGEMKMSRKAHEWSSTRIYHFIAVRRLEVEQDAMLEEIMDMDFEQAAFYLIDARNRIVFGPFYEKNNLILCA